MNAKVSMAIAKDEWRYWRRSGRGVISGVTALMLIVASLVSTVMHVETESTSRENFQAKALEAFAAQPARHPHRMIHYGHYVFRVPPPLSVIDPGVDAFAGTVMFLEGHRQNSAVFSPRYAGARAGPFADLSPAFTYQILLPLLLIVLGFASIPREREGRTDYFLYAATVTAADLWLGKTIALVGAAGLSLVPFTIGLAFAYAAGESFFIALYMFIGYGIYLLTWVFLITGLSAWARSAVGSFSVLLTCWVLLCVIIPPVVGSVASTAVPNKGKIASDLLVAQALRGSGDGHNVNDPAFVELRAQLLEQYKVENVADLPINLRGVVSQIAETKQSEVLNAFADNRMSEELAQSKIVYWLGFISPALALKNYSAITAGTDLRQYHRFQHEAEALRYNFVQKLNKLHAEELAYTDDIQRSNDSAAEQRTRVSSTNWRMLEDVPVRPTRAVIRIFYSMPHFLIILAWCGLMIFVGLSGMSRRAQDVN